MWTETLDGERLLLYSNGDDNRMVVLSTDAPLRSLQSAPGVYMDGTFAAPDLWNQLYVLHARVESSSYPLVYPLIPSLTSASYRRLLKIHVQGFLNQHLSPENIQTDFEMAAFGAVQIEFPDSEVKGCFFHYVQATWRKVQVLELDHNCREDPEVEKWVRRASALPSSSYLSSPRRVDRCHEYVS